MSDHEAVNVKLISHDLLKGFGGLGEGMMIQEAKGGRRIMWLAHEGAPKNFTGVDITDKKNPKVIVQTELAHNNMRSNSLDLCGDILAVAYQTLGPKGLGDPGLDMDPAGIELFDVSNPENPKSIALYSCKGPGSFGVHQLWFADGDYIHFAGGSSDFTAKNVNDSQFYQCIDVRDPSNPKEVGRWWLPGTREGDAEEMPKRHPQFDSGHRAHNTNVYPERPDRLYLCYLDSGTFILDISDKANPTVIGSWNPHPPYPGFAHTALPLFDRDLLIVTDECVRNGGGDWPKLTWVLDMRDETNLVSISTLPLPPVEEMSQRPGRFGSHNIHENQPGSFKSETLIFGTYFNGGMRVHDISNPYQPKEVASFIPDIPADSRAGAAQINDVYVDLDGTIYCVDRFVGGLYALEPDF
jgi:hypothetical protein